MLKNYFKTAFRSLLNNKFYTILNVAGLTTGLAVGILIVLWVQNEMTYDRFHRDSKNIYRVLSNMGSGSNRQIWSNSHAPMASFAKKDIPEIKNAVRIKENHDFSLFGYKDKQFKEDKKAYIDPSFFSVFDFKLKKGDPRYPFKTDNSVVLTAPVARKYFGDEEPIGKIIVADNKEQFIVTGVLEEFPENSSIRYDMLFPMSFYAKIFSTGHNGKTIDQDWGNFSYITYLQLDPAASAKTVSEKLSLMLKNNYKDIGIKDPYGLQRLTDMHLYKTDGTEGGMQTVRIFLVVAVLILVIGCINYINLSTARSMLRAKEVSVRKMIGAAKAQLFAQFFIETALVFFFASIGAVMVVYLLMPLYNDIAGKDLHFSITDPNIWTVVGITVITTLVLSSIYPAWLLSSFEPLKALKGKLSAGISAASLRKVLVTAQFVFSVALIAGTFIVDRQLNYIHNKELGYDKEHVFTFGMRDMMPHALSVKAELSKIQGVKGVAFADDQLVNISVTTGKTDWDGKAPDQEFFVHPITIDKDFVSVFKLQIVNGSSFTGIASDSAHYILNETALRESGIVDPIGKRFKLWNKEGIIIGIVKDFHFESLKQKIEPSVFAYSPANYEMYVKTTGKDAAHVISSVEKLWKQYNGAFPFEYSFLDETYDNLYKSEQRTATLFKLFSVVAIVVSCLGLFGLATFTAQVKTKEIGIRKVLGASVTGIVRLLAKDFMGLILLAIFIAIPLSWYVANNWIQDYAYRVTIEWWMFALAGLIAILIALITVSFQSIKAALMNPVKSLRSE